MASPTGSGATSPPGPSPLALPKTRPSLSLPGQKSRKPSIASATSSAHPLRQTSFPPPESLEAQHAAALDAYSPSQASAHESLEDLSDTEIQSALSGPAGEEVQTRKRKRGEKRPRGRPARNNTRTGSVSLVNGEDGTPASKRGGTAGAPSVVTADNADDEEDPDDDGDDGLLGGRAYETGQLDPSEQEKDNLHKSMFRKYMDVVDALPLTDPEREGMSVRDMGERYDVWNRAKLRTGDLRRLVNQTLSQSVPANVVTVVNSYTKMFAGMLIEEAREVQAEWMAMEAKRPDGGANQAYKRLKRTYGDEEETNGEAAPSQSAANGETTTNGIKDESSSPANADTLMNDSNPSTTTLQNSSQPDATQALFPGGAGGLSTSIAECDRGPLLPDHLREALRRYKKARKGGTVGFTGLSLEGREVAAARMGGRRLFR